MEPCAKCGLEADLFDTDGMRFTCYDCNHEFDKWYSFHGRNGIDIRFADYYEKVCLFKYK